MDPRKSVQIFISGKKGFGKTELADHLFDGFPSDRMAIDPNGDLKMPEDTLELEAPLPSRGPASSTGRPSPRKSESARPSDSGPTPARPNTARKWTAP